MTTGNDTVDNRNPTTRAGTYWSRTWNGDDSTTPAVNYPLGQRPLKRARTDRGEHAYVMNLASSNNAATTRTYPGPVTYANSVYGQFGYPGYVSAWTTADDLALVNQLRSKIVGSDFNPLVSLAEANQSLATIFGAAKAIDGAISHLKRGNPKAAAKSIAGWERNHGKGGKTIANAHLGVQYGVVPLLSDVYNAAQTLAHLVSAPVQHTVTVTRKRTGRAISASPGTLEHHASYGFDTGKIKAILREVNIIGLLGLTDPLSVVWEKVPFSFVVDWFIPIGNFLEARNTANNLKGTFVITKTAKWGVANAYLTFTPNPPIIGDFGSCRARGVSVNRTVTTSLPIPLPQVKPLGSSLNWQRTATAVSLLLQKSKSSALN